MIGTKYLSEAVDINNLEKEKLNIIKAPTGSGKTYFALHEISSLCQNALHQAVYLIDTINGKEQILRNYNATECNKYWLRDIEGDYLWFQEDSRVVIMTYAKFGFILSTKPEFYNYFDYIICDELHSLIRFQYFSQLPNYHSIAKEGLERAVTNSKTMLYNIVDDRHFSITAPVEISDQFYGWVLGFGKKAKILKPQKVVDGFTEYLDKVRKIYES